MPIINRTFNAGLDLDNHPYRVVEGSYIDALNITRDAQGEASDEVVSNILGNTVVTNSLPSGQNKIISSYPDKVRNRLYFFNWNSNNYDGIYYYNKDTDSVVKLLINKTDTSGVDVLNFNPSYKITSINIIYRDAVEGDLLFFNDAYNEPRVINVSANFGTSWKAEYLSVAKAPPIMPLKPVYENDATNTIINTTILDVSKSTTSNLFTGGLQTNYVSFDSFSSTEFTTNVSKDEFTYIGSGVNMDLNVTLLMGYNFPVGTVEISMLLNGVEISGSLQTIPAGYGGLSYSKSINIPLVTNDVIKIKFYLSNSFSYPTYYFNLTSGTLEGVTESSSSNSRVTVNNLRNALFQFRYRYVYDDNEKSVWGSASIVPLPNQPTSQLTYDTFTDNARISLSYTTGNEQVKAIELAFRKFSNGSVTDWQLIDKINKTDLAIPDNDIKTYKFYNDGIYNTIDILDTEKLQDYVPQLANAGELANGNTLIYSGITEGYDSLKSNISELSNLNTGGFFYDYNGLLFFAAVNGNDSGSQGTSMKIFLYGTGTNGTTTNEVEVLNNGKATFVIDVVDNLNAPIGISYTGVTALSVNVALGSISALLAANGWNETSLVGNVLTMLYPTTVTLNSSGTKLIASTENDLTTSFANVFEGAYQVGVMYFDSKGRTNGVITNVTASYNTPKNTTVNYCQPRVSINHRPPTWASYYQIVRSNNTTYNKRLNWVSNSAFSANQVTPSGNVQFSYIGISNLDYYNEQIKATQGVVNYNFTEGDRIRFLKRYNSSGTALSVTVYDYEILGVESSVVVDGAKVAGKFIKIYHPSTDGSVLFDGSADYQNYQILIYNYTQQTGSKNKVFHEFGKCFGVGNAGTANAYHIGLNQSQSATDPTTTPAIIDIVNGDLFFRKRTVPIGANEVFNAGMFTQNTPYATATANITGSPITVGSYVFANQTTAVSGVGVGDYPTNANTDCVFTNNSSVSVGLRLSGSLSAYSDITSSIKLLVKITNSSGVSLSTIMTNQSLTIGNASYSFEFDTTITVPANSKVFLLNNLTGRTSTAPELGVGQFELKVDVLNNITIPIIESSFSDVYNIVTNSNGRESIVDENARKTYYPTLTRFSQSYQQDTNINGVNRFFFDNQDTYDRSFGDVQRLHVRDRYMKVYQRFKVGNVPILTQIVKDVSGNPLQANTDQLINKIQYYSGDYGIGDSTSSLAWDNFADYFVDDFRGVVCRLSQNGIEPISILYKTNAFFVKNLKAYRKSLNNGIAPSGEVYSGDATLYGCFDAATNKYILAMEEINRYSTPYTVSFHQDSYTISFDERKNQFDSFYSYKPECINCLNTLVLSFKNGAIWKHDSETHCNFYGTQYEANITPVFNNFGIQKKTWVSIAEFSNTVWDCPSIISQMNTYGSTAQNSLIPSANFKTLESNYHSNFLRDMNSNGSLINGSTLKGNYLTIKLRKTNANQFFYINLVSVKYIDSPLTNS